MNGISPNFLGWAEQAPVNQEPDALLVIRDALALLTASLADFTFAEAEKNGPHHLVRQVCLVSESGAFRISRYRH
jgi:hypothetical protein